MEEPKALFFLFAERESMSGTELGLSPIEFHKFFFEFLASLLELSFLFGVILLQLFEFGMQLIKKGEINECRLKKML
jgi:hypothetical protein